MINYYYLFIIIHNFSNILLINLIKYIENVYINFYIHF